MHVTLCELFFHSVVTADTLPQVSALRSIWEAGRVDSCPAVTEGRPPSPCRRPRRWSPDFAMI